MHLQETLTKENFWNDMMSKYPNATKAFCDWIDEYKKEVGWNKLFSHGVPKHEVPQCTDGTITSSYSRIEAPKFHDLPHAMQLGIWMEYVCQRGGCQWPIDDFFEFDLRADIEETFKQLLEEEATEELAS